MIPNLEPIDAAGGLVLDSEDRILLIFKDGKWDLPKGIVEGALDAENTALSEIEEETGLAIDKLSIIGELPPTHHISKYRKTRYIKRTHWFLVRHLGDDNFAPQLEEGIEHCQWFHPWELGSKFDECPARTAYLLKYWLKARKLINE